MANKYLLVLPQELHKKIKQESRKHGLTINDYIVIVLEQFLAIQTGHYETERSRSAEVESGR